MSTNVKFVPLAGHAFLRVTLISAKSRIEKEHHDHHDDHDDHDHEDHHDGHYSRTTTTTRRAPGDTRRLPGDPMRPPREQQETLKNYQDSSKVLFPKYWHIQNHARKLSSKYWRDSFLPDLLSPEYCCDQQVVPELLSGWFPRTDSLQIIRRLRKACDGPTPNGACVMWDADLHRIR